MPVVNVGTVKE